MSIFIVALISSLVINLFFFVAGIKKINYLLTFILVALEFLLTQTSFNIIRMLLAAIIVVAGAKLSYKLVMTKTWYVQAVLASIILWPALLIVSLS